MSQGNVYRNASVAVIGSGYWGKNLVRNYHQLGVLKLICDKNESVLLSFKNQYPEVETCMALNDVLSRQDINGIVIATPAETHYNLAREALLSGKHVYVEKPLVLDETEALELIDIADQGSLVLMVGHLLHYHPVFVKLKELALGGDLGRINYIYSNRLNLGKIRREENILWSFAPHDISMILSLAGEMPESVYATGGNYLHRKIADVTMTHLDFPSGMRAHIFVSWLHPYKEQKLVVVGDRKMAVFNDTEPWADKLLIYPHSIDWQNNIPVPNKADAERVEVVEDEPLKLECLHFIKSFSNSTRPETDGNEGLRVLRILKASQHSLDENGCKIRVHEGSEIEKEKAGSTSADDSGEKRYFAHESSVIDPDVTIGDGAKIWHFSHLLSNSSIGKNCNIGQNVVIGPDVTIGKNCKIQNNVGIFKGITLEDGVFCGPSMVFTNIINPRAEIRKMGQIRNTLVKKGATLGANCTILCGVTIGRYGFVGAGAVVTRDVPDYALVAGNPAAQIGWACECGARLKDSMECSECEKKYRLAGDLLETITATNHGSTKIRKHGKRE